MLILSSVLVSIIFVSFLEWFIHRYFMHKPYFLRQVYVNHAKLHHREYFEKFNFEPDEAGRQLNIKLDIGEALLYGSPIFVLLYLLNPIFCFSLMGVLIFHHLLWNIIHDEMHNPKYNWRRKIPGFKFLEEYHWLHHRYTGKNYNVVFPFWDYLLGTHIKASERDKIEMKEELK